MKATVMVTILLVTKLIARTYSQQNNEKPSDSEIVLEEPCSGIEVVVKVSEKLVAKFCKYPHELTDLPPDPLLIEADIEDYVASLKSFVFPTIFNVHGFEAEGIALKDRLVEIQHSIENMRFVHNELLIQFAFAQKMFSTMVESIELLKYYETSEIAGRHFMCAVIDLNIRILALRDSHGRPADNAQNMSILANSYMEYLDLLKQGFEHEPDKTFGKRVMFETHFSRARASLDDLMSYFTE